MESLYYRLAMSCISICFHITSKAHGTVPGSYRECFRTLYKLGIIIDEELANILEDFAGLRNVIAHAYWDLNYARLYDNPEQLYLIARFKNTILKKVL